MSKKKNTATPPSFFDKMENFLQKNDRIFFWIIFGITALIAILLYDPRVSLAGDDSAYIIRANNLIKNFAYPGYQGPLYPIALVPIVLVFGISLFPLKLFSLLSMLGFMYFTFIAFRKKIPACILLPVLLLVSVNSFVLYYASQTFSEAFYMFMQSLFVYVFMHFFITGEDTATNNKRNIKGQLWLALSILGVVLTRSVGFSAIIAVAGYFLLYKEWKNLGLSIAFFAALFIIYSLLKNWIWGNSELQFSTQGSSLLSKDFYHPEGDKETIGGLLIRFWQNSVQYLSNGFFRIMGFHYQVGENSVFRTLLVYALAIGGLCFSYKKSKSIFFAIVVTGTFLIVTFVSLQVFWNQERLIIPVYPFILLSIFTCLYYILSIKKLRSLQFLYIIPIVILLFTGIRDTAAAIPEARKLKDQYSGLTPDWINYMKASNWASKNLKESDLVASRKPEISTVYGNGKNFYGIYRVPAGNAELFLQEWAKNPSKYIAVPVNEQSFNYYDNTLREHYYARMEVGNGALWVLNNDDGLNAELAQKSIPAIPLQQIQAISSQPNGSFSIFYADSLLKPLNDRGVTHIMTASLRINPNMKTGQTISTVERYAFYIQEKYPDIFNFVYQEGKDNNEPARIFEINWSAVQ